MNKIETKNILGRKHIYVNDELVYRETEPDHSLRDYWCICKEDGSIIGMQETLKGGLSAGHVAYSFKDSENNVYTYKITLLQFSSFLDERRESMLVAKNTQSPRIYPIDYDFIKGKRVIESKVENGIVMKKLDGGGWAEFNLEQST